MLEYTAPVVETGGFDGRLIGMLRDSGENINWREISAAPRNPNHERVPVYADEMPPPPTGDYKSILKVGHTQSFYFPRILFSN